MTEYIWLIGGSLMARPMCDEIKRRGFKILLTDGNPECYCQRLADYFHTISAYDVRDHLYFASSIKATGQFNIAAVLTIGTDAGPTVSALSDYFGLPGIGQKTAQLVKNKIAMRQALDLDHPYFYIHHEGGSLDHLSADRFPLVIKPPDQAGSRGVAIARDIDDLRQIIAERSGDLLLEEWLSGENCLPSWVAQYGLDTSEAAFDFFIEDGRVIYANGALRMFWLTRPGIEAGHINPFPANGDIMALANRAAARLGVKWGPFKLDVKQDERYGWCLLECATRLSGGFDHMYTSPLATGRDVTGVMLDVALGGKVDIKKLVNQDQGYAVCYAPCYEPGDLIHWQQPADDRFNDLFILQYETISPLNSNQDRPAFIVNRSALNPEVAMHKNLAAATYLRPVYKERL